MPKQHVSLPTEERPGLFSHQPFGFSARIFWFSGRHAGRLPTGQATVWRSIARRLRGSRMHTGSRFIHEPADRQFLEIFDMIP